MRVAARPHGRAEDDRAARLAIFRPCFPWNRPCFPLRFLSLPRAHFCHSSPSPNHSFRCACDWLPIAIYLYHPDTFAHAFPSRKEQQLLTRVLCSFRSFLPSCVLPSQLYVRGFIQCRFGGTSSNGIVIGPSTIQCSAPGLAPQPRGWVDVELVTSHQGAAAVGVHYQGQHLAGKFYYHSVNVVSRIEPPTGPTNGGTAIALYGRFDHFASLRCRFGSQSEALTVPRFVDASRIECTSAPQAVPAAHIVQVTSNGQQYCESSVHFT
jgi:hypothetical protein